MARLLMAILVSLGLASLPVAVVVACSCAVSTIQQSARFADVVFTGTAMAVETPAPAPITSSLDPVRYAFSTDEVFKGGMVESEVVVTTAMDGASCGTTFGMGERWLVFASVDGTALTTGLCSGNLLLDDADTEREALAQLGPPIGEPTASPAEQAGATLEPPGPLVALLAAAAVVIVISALAFARTWPRLAR